MPGLSRSPEAPAAGVRETPRRALGARALLRENRGSGAEGISGGGGGGATSWTGGAALYDHVSRALAC